MGIKLENSTRREVKAGAVDVEEEEDGAFNSLYGGGRAGSVFSSGVWVSVIPFLLPFSLVVGLALPKAIESPRAASACTVQQCPCRLLTPPYSSLLLPPPLPRLSPLGSDPGQMSDSSLNIKAPVICIKYEHTHRHTQVCVLFGNQGM